MNNTREAWQRAWRWVRTKSRPIDDAPLRDRLVLALTGPAISMKNWRTCRQDDESHFKCSGRRITDGAVYSSEAAERREFKLTVAKMTASRDRTPEQVALLAAEQRGFP